MDSATLPALPAARAPFARAHLNLARLCRAAVALDEARTAARISAPADKRAAAAKLDEARAAYAAARAAALRD